MAEVTSSESSHMRLIHILLISVALISIGISAADPNKPTQTVAECPDDGASLQLGDVSEYLHPINACSRAGKFEAALTIALHAKTFASTTPNKTDDYSALLYEATALHFMGLYNEALTRYEQIRINANEALPRVVQSAYNNSAVLFQSLGQYDAAMQMIESALTIDQTEHVEQSKETRSNAVATFASILLSVKQFDESQKAIDECMKLGKEQNHSLVLVYCSQTEAELYLAKNKFDIAYLKADAAITLAKEKKILSDLAEIYLTRAKAEAALGKVEQAVETTHIGIAIATEQQDRDSVLACWRFLEQLHRANSNWSSAYSARIGADEIERKIFDLKLANTVAYQRVQRDIEKKEQEISLLKSESELHQAEADKAKAQRTATISISILLLAVIFIGYSRWIHKRDLARAEKTNAELHHLNELKDQFLSNTSHELRTPLNGIIGLSDILSETEATTLSSMGRTQLGLIRDCGVQLSEMVDSILDFSQIRAGKHVVHIEAISLNDIMQKVFAILQPLAQRKSLTFELNLPEKDVTVLADANRLRQILINLVGNAIKFTDSGVVSLVASVNNQCVAIQVRDSGVGIPSDRLQSIFEPFEQVDGSLRRRNGGVGLGLAIAKELVKAHGSELKVNSVVGVGTEFGFTLSEA